MTVQISNLISSSGTDFIASTSLANVGEQFGKSASIYAAGRKGYGEGLYQHLKQLFKPDAAILDIGCGTGIATRELYESGFHNLQGSDIDSGMLQEAERCNQELGINIPYKKSSATELPQVFQGECFDAITAFSCFHWFSKSTEAIDAIRSKLKPGGAFIVVAASRANLNEALIQEFWSIIAHVSGKAVHDPRQDYNPKEILERHGFQVQCHDWCHEEVSTFDEAMAKLQSFSGWCALTEEQKNTGLPLLEEFAKRIAEALMRKTIKVTCYIAK